MMNRGYEPRILHTAEDIASAMGVSTERIKEWSLQGAPILVEGEGKRRRYRAEVMELWQWRIENNKT